MTYKTFFGDSEKTFALTPPMIDELEKTTGCGIGVLFKRLRTSEFSFNDIIETVRLSLIGGGTTPANAASLIATYGIGRPIGETFAIALNVMTIAYFGPDEQPGQEVAE